MDSKASISRITIFFLSVSLLFSTLQTNAVHLQYIDAAWPKLSSAEAFPLTDEISAVCSYDGHRPVHVALQGPGHSDEQV